MIGRLSGLVVDARPDELLLDVGGVGYRVQIPLSTYFHVASGSSATVTLHIHTHVREDALALFGFWTEAERFAFGRLIAVSGIGPRIALAVLSGIEVSDLERAVHEGDTAVLEKIPGIGRKTSQRVVLELRDRFGPADSKGRRGDADAKGAGSGRPVYVFGPDGDAVAALVRLGYGDAPAREAVALARRAVGAEASLEELLRSALRSLVR